MVDKILLDTNILINILRFDDFPDNWENYIKYISSISVLETQVGIRTARESRIVNSLLSVFDKKSRIVVPVLNDYYLAGKVISRLHKPAEKIFRDALIAVCAKQIGAELWTNDKKDIPKISKLLKIKFRVFNDSRS